jgi:Protein of unknown function (DUF3168)
MTVEADIFTALKGLVGNRCYPDVAPISTVKPYITYTQIGGEAISYTDDLLPDHKHGRFQVNVWAGTRASASSIILQVESAMVLAQAFQARPIGAPSSDYDHDMQTYGSMQDFNVTSTR